jgi:hypothetical protein
VNAAWAAVLLGGGGFGGGIVSWVITMLTRAAAHAGKVDQILDELTGIAKDHETRLRAGHL